MSSASRQIASRSGSKELIVIKTQLNPDGLLPIAAINTWANNVLNKSNISVNANMYMLNGNNAKLVDLLTNDASVTTTKGPGLTTLFSANVLGAGETLINLGKEIYLGTKQYPRQVRLLLVQKTEGIITDDIADGGGEVGYICIGIKAVNKPFFDAFETVVATGI